MNAEIDKLLDEAADLAVGVLTLLRTPSLSEVRFPLQELTRALDRRLAKVMELRSEADEAEQAPKLSSVP